jgi:quinol monooxygenase YgiN
MNGLLIHFDIAPGKQADFEAAMAFHIGNVRARDPSYSLYSLTRSRDDGTRYILVQQFDSMETQARHQTYDYVQAAMPAIDACLAGPPRCEWLDVVL